MINLFKQELGDDYLIKRLARKWLRSSKELFCVTNSYIVGKMMCVGLSHTVKIRSPVIMKHREPRERLTMLLRQSINSVSRPNGKKTTRGSWRATASIIPKEITRTKITIPSRG